MGIQTLRQVEASLSPVPVYPGCKLRKGQSVMFKNYYGVTFGPHKIIGFCDGSGPLYKYGKHVYLDLDSYWCPVAEASLSEPVTILKTEIVTGFGERLTMSDGSIWMHSFGGGKPIEEKPAKLACGHDHYRDGTSSGGCVTMLCRKCGDEYERDVS